MLYVCTVHSPYNDTLYNDILSVAIGSHRPNVFSPIYRYFPPVTISLVFSLSHHVYRYRKRKLRRYFECSFIGHNATKEEGSIHWPREDCPPLS